MVQQRERTVAEHQGQTGDRRHHEAAGTVAEAAGLPDRGGDEPVCDLDRGLCSPAPDRDGCTPSLGWDQGQDQPRQAREPELRADSVSQVPAETEEHVRAVRDPVR